MSFFSSKREKRLWICTLIVVAAIYSTLIFASTLTGLAVDHGLTVLLFFLGMFLIALTVLTQGLELRLGKAEFAVVVGVSAVYLMVFLRLAIPERSHLMEYSVLAVFIYEALLERKNQGRRVPVAPLLAILATSLIGLIDEAIQLFIPHRVFDPQDILFNVLASVLAVLASLSLSWAKRRFSKADGS